MIRKYIWNNGQITGLLVALRDGDNLKVGYSLLHPRDQQEIVEYNKRVKRTNAESHKINNALVAAGKEATEPVERYKPAFDKKLALEIATDNATHEVDVFSKHPKVQQELHKFVEFAHWRLRGKVSFV